MSKKIMCILAALAVGVLFTFASNVMADDNNNVGGREIVIDAGHGGIDSGSGECPELDEKDANLEVAKELRDLLEENGATVYMTREDNTYLTNRDRYTFANGTNGEILVSIHFNGSTDHGVNYTQGLYSKWTKDINLAATIHNQLFSSLGIGDGGLLHFSSGVILKAEMPATIQEVAFISNTTECSRLTDGTGDRQQQIADLLYDGINDWFGDNILEAHPGRK